MLAELIQAVRDLTVTHGFTKVHTDSKLLPQGHYFELEPGGKIKVTKAPEPPLNAIAHNLATLVALAAAGPAAGPEVWYDEGVITGHPNPAYSPAKIVMPLRLTSKWKMLEAVATKGYKQADFLRMLRLQLSDSVNTADYEAIKRIVFKHQQENSGTVDRTKASVGRTIENSLHAERIPETLDIKVQVYENLPYLVAIRCALEIDLDRDEFQLIPLPLQLVHGQQQVMKWVHEELLELRESALWPIYYGRQDRQG